MKRCLPLLLLLTVLVSCGHKDGTTASAPVESKQAKALLQGIWVDAETGEVLFRAKGDTIYYPDSTSMPTYFMVADDSLMLGDQHYPIMKQSPHQFWFKNHTGDLVKLNKSDDPNDALIFSHEEPLTLTMVSEMQKKDSVVIFGGQRYHWYIAINPTRYRVAKTTYNDDGVGVENIYYDNIINISIYKGAERLYSSDFKKQMYNTQIPDSFLGQAILGNMEFDHVDEEGFHFNATICVPDGAACYLVSTDIGFNGDLSMKLMEY